MNCSVCVDSGKYRASASETVIAKKGLWRHDCLYMAAPRLTSNSRPPPSANQRRACVIIGALAVLLWPAAAICAQDKPPAQPLSPPTAEVIEERRQEAAASADLDAATKTKVDGVYQQAATELANAKASAAKAKGFDQQAADAPQALAKLQRTLAGGPGANEFAAPPMPI